MPLRSGGAHGPASGARTSGSPFGRFPQSLAPITGSHGHLLRQDPGPSRPLLAWRQRAPGWRRPKSLETPRATLEIPHGESPARGPTVPGLRLCLIFRTPSNGVQSRSPQSGWEAFTSRRCPHRWPPPEPVPDHAAPAQDASNPSRAPHATPPAQGDPSAGAATCSTPNR
jgi:hypothetical protein